MSSAVPRTGSAVPNTPSSGPSRLWGEDATAVLASLEHSGLLRQLSNALRE
jgi:hypothetical protein